MEKESERDAGERREREGREREKPLLHCAERRKTTEREGRGQAEKEK